MVQIKALIQEGIAEFLSYSIGVREKIVNFEIRTHKLSRVNLN